MQYCLFIKGPTTLGVYTKVKSMFTTLKMSTNEYKHVNLPNTKVEMTYEMAMGLFQC